MRILLVHPRSGPLTIGLKDISKLEPLALEILAATAAEQGHTAAILDMELHTDLAATLKQFQPDVVGVTAQIVHTYEALRVLKTAKAFNPRVYTVVGGHHPSLAPQEFNAPYVDAIALGEGVPIFQELLARWSQHAPIDDVAGLALPRDGQLVFTPPRRLPTSLDHQPLPDRSLTAADRPRYFYLFESPVASIQTSMGCTFPCNFCSCQKFSKRHFIPHSPERIVEDLSRIREQFVLFCDDHSFIDVKRMEKLHDLIVRRGIKKRYFAYSRTDCIVQHPEVFRAWGEIGLSVVMTGLEAIDDSSMDALNKRNNVEVNEQAIRILQDCGIGVSAGFVILPEYTEADFKRIDSYVAARPNIVLTELTPLTPLPATDLYAEQQGHLLTDNREVFDLVHFVVPTQLEARQLYRLMRRYYWRAVLRAIWRLGLYHPRYITKRHLPRLLAGALRVAWHFGHAHKSIGVSAPEV